jgi:hypothetical protein
MPLNGKTGFRKSSSRSPCGIRLDAANGRHLTHKARSTLGGFHRLVSSDVPSRYRQVCQADADDGRPANSMAVDVYMRYGKPGGPGRGCC